MSDMWLNIRILYWHFQIREGDLFTVRVSKNSSLTENKVKAKPVAVHDFRPADGLYAWLP